MDNSILINLLDNSEQYKNIKRFLAEGDTNVQVEGLTAAAKGTFICALKADCSRPILIVTYSYEQAERLHDNISSLGIVNGDLILVPPADSMIYQESDTDLDIISRRLTALSRLQDGNPCVVIAPIAAVLQRTLPPDILAAHRVRVMKSQELDLEDCIRRLVGLGYEHSMMVERQGEFSRRGGILDIFPSTTDYPIRIELFGDDVESIRSFDIETQRSREEIDSIEIVPSRELLFDEENAAKVSGDLSRLLETEVKHLQEGSDPGAADRLSEHIQNDIARIESRAYFDGIEYYMPVIYSKSYSMLDYLPSNALVILDEPHQIESHWLQLHEELLESLEVRITRGDVLALPSDHVLPFDEFAGQLRNRHQNILLSLLPRELDWINTGEHIALTAAPMESFGAEIGMFIEQLRTWLSNDCRILLITHQSQRIVELLSEHGLSTSPISDLIDKGSPGIYVMDGDLASGFKLQESKLMVVTHSEIFGLSSTRRPKRTFKKGMAISSILELKEGDYVVHINHGIGVYRGFTKLPGQSGDRDYLLLEYAGADRLYVPVDQIDRVQKYIGADGQGPVVHKLGGTEWAKTTKRVKQSVREMAKELLEIYAARQSQEGYMFSPDTPWQQEMESAFQYEETPDQFVAIQEVKQDLELPKPMDRLVCGDVGYGKTEVAMRAVFKVVNDGKQVAVLAPTTVLAQQHFNTFSERFAAYPVKIEMLSRFRSRAEQKKAIEGLKAGTVDVVIGTHRLLSKDIDFRDLGLVVVDEEQRFGVAHKERLKKLRKTVDVLTLTATPIPRTLHMSLSGIRDMSLISDPPEGRSPIKTYCREYDDELVRDAILRELDRDGQVFFVHNRVEKIEHVADHIRKLVPYARVEVGHGQMDEDDLERVMVDVYEHRFDVLVCTTIIESGLDIPNVNTIIINNADKMGLAQLYQLRGRVGRSNRQAYAYMFYEPHRIMSEVAEKRLQAVREFTDLGSGFKIALRDLEIRGAGNLLGSEQHGQMVSVGFDMYCQLLSEAVSELKGEESKQSELPPVDLPVNAFIPVDYIPEESQRMMYYKKMTAVRDAEDVDKIGAELKDRFGTPPPPVMNSLELLRLRIKCMAASITLVSTDRQQVAMKFVTGVKLAADVARDLRKKYPGCVFSPEKVLVDVRMPRLMRFLGYILDDLPEAVENSRLVYMARLG